MSSRRRRWAVVACAVGLSVLSACGQDPNQPILAQDNILILIADDLGIEKVGVFHEGDNATRPLTPNIDALAASGVRFVNAYGNANCSPTRATILTGRYGFRTGIGQIIYGGDDYGLPETEISLPELLDLAGSGYDHSLCGKWHLTPLPTGGPYGPLLHGFAWAAGSEANLGAYGCTSCTYFSWIKRTNGVLHTVTTYATTDTANDAIDRANAMTPPWLLWVAYNAPHQPVHVPPEDLHTWPDPDRNDVSRYAATAEALDTEIGRMMASIRPEILARTTVIFLGDNGTPGFAVVPPFIPSRAKGTLYEGGINVPFIISGAVPPRNHGQASTALVNTADIFTTSAALAGVDLAAVLPPDYAVDGVNLLPLLEEPQGGVVRDYAYSERFLPNGPPPQSLYWQMIRDRRWKVLRRHAFGGNPPYVDEFFDLDAAPPGTDGQNACPCPENLSGAALEAYLRLAAKLESIHDP